MPVSAVFAASSSPTAKVPEVSVLFWIAKILTTGLGETSSDFLVKTFDPLIVIPLTGIALVVALLMQWRSRRYSKWRYWTSVGLVAVFGTMAADAIHVVAGVPYAASSAVFAVLLAGGFFSWNAVEHSLSIHSIFTPRREAFYWTTVMITFALGTAVGDLTASTFHLGYAISGLLFLVLFLIPISAWRIGNANEVLTFWVAYILTRPLGASFADWIGVGHERGGLGLGTGLVSVVLLAITVGVVAIGAFPAAFRSAHSLTGPAGASVA
jgi:uncharacterized membrane-anchored protein